MPTSKREGVATTISDDGKKGGFPNSQVVKEFARTRTASTARLLFNISIAFMYFLLLKLFGMAQIAAEYAEMGRIMTIVMLILGNITFFLLDRLLSMRLKIR